MTTDNFEGIIGLEVHLQLNTKTKAYSDESADYFSATPNNLLSFLTVAYPGTLPVFNKKVLEYAVKLGSACNSEIASECGFARKNYFYYDLPKGYQISQDDIPVCKGGKISIRKKDGEKKEIQLVRIHMEEDAGKNVSTVDPFNMLVDLNRCGVPLLEIVTEPEFSSADEAILFLNTVRNLARYLEISDGNMEEGSMRCDVNISVKRKNEKKLGERVEIKNMNSFRGISQAITHEIERQTNEILKGNVIEQETRTFDPEKRVTIRLRTKEKAHDYRYFPEPDLPPLKISSEYVSEIKKTLPLLPEELFSLFTSKLGLSVYDTQVLLDDKQSALYFFEITKHTKNTKAAANWMNVHIRSYLKENSITISDFPVTPEKIGGIIELVDNGIVSNSAASQKLFPALVETPLESVDLLCGKLDIKQIGNADIIEKAVQEVLAKFPEKVEEYKNGKKGLRGLFIGEVMKKTQGKADPKIINTLLNTYIS